MGLVMMLLPCRLCDADDIGTRGSASARDELQLAIIPTTTLPISTSATISIDVLWISNCRNTMSLRSGTTPANIHVTIIPTDYM